MTEVVVILPFVKDRVLLQLRDFKSEIEFPGCWGFFGGSINNGEKPEDAAIRELFEEIGYSPQKLYGLGCRHVADLDDLVSHSFCCDLSVPVESLVLNEGVDFTLMALEEVQGGLVYSPKLQRNFPVANTHYIPDTIRQALTLMRVTVRSLG